MAIFLPSILMQLLKSSEKFAKNLISLDFFTIRNKIVCFSDLSRMWNAGILPTQQMASSLDSLCSWCQQTFMSYKGEQRSQLLLKWERRGSSRWFFITKQVVIIIRLNVKYATYILISRHYFLHKYLLSTYLLSEIGT